MAARSGARWPPSAASSSATATSSSGRAARGRPLVRPRHHAPARRAGEWDEAATRGVRDPGRGERRASGRRARRPRPVAANVKVSDGCDRRCAYCAIPLIKGDYETVPPAQVLAQARAALARARASWCSSARTRRATRRPATAASTGCWPTSPRSARLAASPLPAARRHRRAPARGHGALHALPYVDVPLQHASGRIARRDGEERATASVTSTCSIRCARALPGRRCARPSSSASPARPTTTSTSSSTSSRPRGSRWPASSPSTRRRGRAPLRSSRQVEAEVRLERRQAWAPPSTDVAAELLGGLVGRTSRRSSSVRPWRAREAVGRIAAQAPDVDGRRPQGAGAASR
jgi:hypothetical protein